MDKWGRPDINTGLGLMRGMMDLKTFQNRQQDRAFMLQDRETDKQAYELAGLLANPQSGRAQLGLSNIAVNMPEGEGHLGGRMPVPKPLNQTDYDPEVWLKGHSLHHQKKLEDFATKQKQFDLSEEGRLERAGQAVEGVTILNKAYSDYASAVKGGASKIAQVDYAIKMIDRGPNGVSAKMLPDKDKNGLFQVEISTFGEGSEIVSLTNENIDMYLAKANKWAAGHFSLDAQRQFELQVNNGVLNRDKNAKSVAKAIADPNKAYIGKDNNIWYFTENFIDKQTGELTGGVFFDPESGKVVGWGTDEAKAMELRPYKEITAELSRRDKESLVAQRKKVTEQRGKVTLKEQRTSKARLKAADTKEIRSLEKELRKLEAELTKQEAEGRNILVEGKAEPIYEATKHNVQQLKDKIGELKGTKKAKPKDLTETMPPAEQHEGKVIRDTENNKRYKSDGTQWIEID